MNRLSIVHSVMTLSAKRNWCERYAGVALFAKWALIGGKATAFGANGAMQESCLSREGNGSILTIP